MKGHCQSKWLIGQRAIGRGEQNVQSIDISLGNAVIIVTPSYMILEHVGFGERKTLARQSSTENGNLAVQQQFVAAVFAGDADTILALAAPDFTLHEGSGMPFAGIYEGGEGFLSFLGVFADTFEIERLEPVCGYASDDPGRMAFEFDFRATVKATGELFESSIIETWKFRDGKVESIKAHYFNVPAA